ITDVTVVIPAANEAATIGGLIQQLNALPRIKEILVIDAGSTDGTAIVAERVGARVIRHSRRRGNGAAVKTGLHQAATDWVLIMDADGQHGLEDALKVLDAPEQWDLVVG